MAGQDYHIFEYRAHLTVGVRVAVHVPDGSGCDQGDARAAGLRFVGSSPDARGEALRRASCNDLSDWESAYVGPAVEGLAFDQSAFVIGLDGEEIA